MAYFKFNLDCNMMMLMKLRNASGIPGLEIPHLFLNPESRDWKNRPRLQSLIHIKIWFRTAFQKPFQYCAVVKIRILKYTRVTSLNPFCLQISLPWQQWSIDPENHTLEPKITDLSYTQVHDRRRDSLQIFVIFPIGAIIFLELKKSLKYKILTSKALPCVMPRVLSYYLLLLGWIMKKVMTIFVKWRPSWTPT